MTFRLAADGLAHVVFPGTVTSLCGATCSGAEVSEGRPCPRCLAAATDHLAA